MTDTPTAEQRAAAAILRLRAWAVEKHAGESDFVGQRRTDIWDICEALSTVEAERDRLRDALGALGSRHGWIPDFGPCICEEHNRARALLRGDTQGNQT